MTDWTIIPLLFFAISVNVDNIIVGLSLGLKKIKVGFFCNLLIASLLTLITILSIITGNIFQTFLSINTANIIGGILLIFIGLYTLWKTIIDGRLKNINQQSRCNYMEILENPEKADSDKSGSINIKESLSLAIVLSFNNLGLGIGVGITSLNIFMASAFAFIFSILFLFLGCYIGKRYFSRLLGKSASIAASLLIILLGVFEIVI